MFMLADKVLCSMQRVHLESIKYNHQAAGTLGRHSAYGAAPEEHDDASDFDDDKAEFGSVLVCNRTAGCAKSAGHQGFCSGHKGFRRRFFEDMPAHADGPSLGSASLPRCFLLLLLFCFYHIVSVPWPHRGHACLLATSTCRVSVAEIQIVGHVVLLLSETSVPLLLQCCRGGCPLFPLPPLPQPLLHSRLSMCQSMWVLGELCNAQLALHMSPLHMSPLHVSPLQLLCTWKMYSAV